MAVGLINRPFLITRSILRSHSLSSSALISPAALTSQWHPLTFTAATLHTKPRENLRLNFSACIRCGNLQHLGNFQHQRWLSKIPTVKPPGKVRMSLLRPYMKVMERMESWLERKYPKAHHIYMLFKIGVRDFFVDMKTFYTVAVGLRTNRPINSFTHSELDAYRQMPWDMLRVAPVLIISALPFMNYVIFPIAYFFPKLLLCRHFWTPQQRLDFGHYYLGQRVHHYPKILHYMEKHTKDVKDNTAKENFTKLLAKIQKGQTLSAQEVLSCKQLFESGPFSLRSLGTIHKVHMWHLSKSLNLSTRLSKLASDILLLHYIDMLINKAGVGSLSMEQLQQACFARGMEAKDVARPELEKYLQNWVQVSSKVDERSLSLLLHCPVFLAFNHSALKPHYSKKKRPP